MRASLCHLLSLTLSIVSVATNPIARNTSISDRKTKDGFAVGPVEIVAESGSNVQIKNTFNIFVVGDGLNADAIALIAARAAEENADDGGTPLVVRMIDRLSPRDRRASKTEDPPAAANTTGAAAVEKKTSSTPLKVTRRTAAVASASNARAQAAASNTSNSSAAAQANSNKPLRALGSKFRPSGRDTDVVENRIEKPKQAGRPAVAPATTSSPARSSTRRPQSPQEGSLEAIDVHLRPSSSRNQQRKGRHTAANTAPRVAAQDGSLEAVDRSLGAVEPTGPRHKRMQSLQQLREHRNGDSEPEFVPEHAEISFEDT